MSRLLVIVDEKGNTITDATAMPPLTERQEQEAEDRTNVSALVVHEAIRKDGDEELRRPIPALAWSGLAAGLSMGFSFVAEALFRTYLPEAPWRPLITNLGYPLGFLIVIVGRQQLFTENTLTAIIPLLARRNLATLWQVLRLWAVVLAANIAGAHIFAWVIAATPVLHPKFHLALEQLATEAADVSFGNAILRGIFAGWMKMTFDGKNYDRWHMKGGEIVHQKGTMVCPLSTASTGRLIDVTHLRAYHSGYDRAL